MSSPQSGHMPLLLIRSHLLRTGLAVLLLSATAYSLGPVAVGFFMTFTARQKKVRYYGKMITR